jgi:hypothetical protein
MENAAYLRARAERCLRLAGLLSDPDAAQALVAKAAELHGHALDLERTPDQNPEGASTLARDQGLRHPSAVFGRPVK